MVNLKGEYNRGLVKRTKQQMKKHRIQMTNEELSFLEHHLKQINQLNYSYHVLNKQISFDKADIENMLKHGNLKSFIVEYNETPTKDGMDRRVLLRGIDVRDVLYSKENGETFNALSNLCVVISLVKHKVITCYWNIANDNHNTIKWDRYNRHLNIIKKD